MSYWENLWMRYEVVTKLGLSDFLIGFFFLSFSFLIFLVERSYAFQTFLLLVGILIFLIIFSIRCIFSYLDTHPMLIPNLTIWILLHWLITIPFLILHVYLIFFDVIGVRKLYLSALTFLVNLTFLLLTKRFRFLGYSALFLVGFVAYWVMPTLHPVLKWGFLFGLPCLVMIVTGFMIFIRFKKSFSDNTQPPAEV